MNLLINIFGVGRATQSYEEKLIKALASDSLKIHLVSKTLALVRCRYTFDSLHSHFTSIAVFPLLLLREQLLSGGKRVA